MKHAKQPQPPTPCQRWDPSPNAGLTHAQAAQRAAEGLANTAAKPLSKTTGQILWDNLFTFFNFLFLALAACLIAVGDWTDVTFLAVVACNLLVGIVQELRVKKVLDRVSLLAQRPVTVIRQGEAVLLPPDQLVLDDIVEFGPGSQICADAILASGRLEVNEALLTGESRIIEKLPGAKLLSGSFVVAGAGRARLEQVGESCWAARIAQAARKHKRHRSEMMRALDRWLRLLSFIIVPLGMFLLTRQLALPGAALPAAVSTTIGAVVGMIPEGLYLLVSVALAVSLMGLARRRVLVHELACIENLARVDTLCLDKTGTITAGTLAVTGLCAAPGVGAAALEAALGLFAHAASSQNPTSLALQARFAAPGAPLGQVREIPFSSERKWAALESGAGQSLVLGAPEMVLPGPLFCQAQLDAELRQGRRALLLAAGGALPATAALPGGLRPLGLVFLQDELRPGAAETLRYFRQQGVTVKVISGDNPVAVARIAQQAGVEGADLWADTRALPEDADWGQIAESHTCFGRVSPQQKRQLIQGLKAKGHTVAMIGDGVNDVLALKDADCSVAMAAGSETAQQVAQIVLLDSDFSAMPHIVAEGRRVMGNIQRAASLFLVKNIFSFLAVLFLLWLPFAYPLTPIQISLFGGLMIGAPSFLLTFEPSFKKAGGHFMRTALLNALPGGITGAVCLVGVSWAGGALGLASGQVSTLCCLLLGVVGLGQLLVVCWPLTGWRATLVALMGFGYYGAAFLLAPLFRLEALTPAAGRLLLLFAVALPAVMALCQGTAFLVKRRLAARERRTRPSVAAPARRSKKDAA